MKKHFLFQFEEKKSQCKTGNSLCGNNDSEWLDKLPMGFPFDRRAGNDTKHLINFLTPNMKTQKIEINFNNSLS